MRKLVVLLFFFAAIFASAKSFAVDVDMLGPYTPSAIQSKKSIETILKDGVSPLEFRLGPYSAAERDKAQTQTKSESAPTQIGFSRSGDKFGKAVYIADNLKWVIQGNGDRVAILKITSPSAQGIRLRLGFEKIHPRVTIDFFEFEGKFVDRITGAELIDQHSISSDGALSFKGVLHYVTPLSLGDTQFVQFTIPESISIDALLLSVDWVSHLVESPLFDRFQPNAQSLSCQRNMACGTTGERSTGHSVARMIYSDPAAGGTYTCSGTLLNNRNQDGIPYFLTANHCISSQAVASTLQTFWFDQTLNCGSVSTGGSVRRSGGATVLYTNATTDTSFLRLNDSAPSGVTYAGWYGSELPLWSYVFGIHHPRGDVKKISYGVNGAYVRCADTESGGYSCSSANAASATDHLVGFDIGTVESGSSGSGIFITLSGANYLVGQLRGGNGVCSTSTTPGIGTYGRFDFAYRNGISRWLSPSVSSVVRAPVYRFYNTQSGTHFFTGSLPERDAVIANLSNYKYEGIAFYTYSTTSTGGYSPVYRFYNTTNNAHFYTISSIEKDSISTNMKNFNLEGVAWHASTSSVPSSSPLYRFYNTTSGTHFYTTSLEERDGIIANLKNYNYEGVAYHVWKTQ